MACFSFAAACCDAEPAKEVVTVVAECELTKYTQDFQFPVNEIAHAGVSDAHGKPAGLISAEEGVVGCPWYLGEPLLRRLGVLDDPSKVFAARVVKTHAGERLGVIVNVVEDGSLLILSEVLEGPITQWNKLNPAMELRAGDFVASVNGCTGSDSMILATKGLELEFVVIRGGLHRAM
eukprot:NODE_18270_length_901_cov_4.901809.p2 GENE.NODE_18270_length_901_cov_4.901809~~NODE_18270_length_901_cov_4.901809.p2  ORF type:complete len:178 (-),score=33.77 NODE_18270_length_901_cov_4.901809:149-682(-)